MKANKVLYGLLASGLAFAGLTQSCVSDEPFANGEGEGTLRMQLVVNSDLTRAAVDDDDLRAGCTVYISGNSGLMYKYQGLENVPEVLNLKSGNYTAEAWTGDSVTASFDKRFFRGFQPFSITQGNNTQVVLTCRIANVVVSVNEKTVDPELMKDWKITVGNSRGELVFDENNMTYDKAYFMMPDCDIALGEDGKPLKASDGWTYYTNLNYTIEGTTAAGEPFKKSGPICTAQVPGNLVEHAHDYVINLVYNPEYEQTGGAFVTVVINEEEIEVKEEVGLFSRPSVKGVGFEIENMVKGQQGQFKDQRVKVTGFGALASVVLSSPDYAAMHLPSQQFDLINMAEDTKAAFRDLGITWDYAYNDERNLATSYILFAEKFLNAIPQRDGEAYAITIAVRDSYGKEFAQDFRIGVGEVEEDPVIAMPVPSNDLLAVRARKAALKVTVAEDAEQAGIEYRVKGGNGSWTFAPATLTRGGTEGVVNLSGLEQNKTYEYRAVAKDFKSTETLEFTTEKEYQLPNAGMENWSTYPMKGLIGTNQVPFPGENGTVSFWDTGNGGGNLARVTMTDKSTELVHGGTYSAKLESMSAAGVIAAGNLFVGKFGEATLSPIGAKLDFGQPYSGGSHPDALSVYVNYRPAAVSSVRKTGTPAVEKGQPDHGQIFIAFATAPSKIDTGNNIFFNPKGDNILGYGEVNWEGTKFGADGKMEKVTVNIDWYEKAKTVTPTHIIIVCSASKYGDYYEGGIGSVMYVDDFELVY